MPLHTSAIGRAVLTAREGCKLKAYQDTVGVWTIGVGHTGRASPPPVSAGMTITQGQADAILAGDLKPFEDAINSSITIPIADHVFDALVSFSFNVGVPGFKGSTTLRKLNDSDIQGAADALLFWEKPLALKSRREAERQQMLTPYTVVLPSARIGETAIATPVAATNPTPLPPVITPSPSPAPSGFWAKFWSALKGKAA